MLKYIATLYSVIFVLNLGRLSKGGPINQLASQQFTRTEDGSIELSIDNVLLAMEKIVHFFAMNKKFATIDLTFGMQMANGELTTLIARVNGGLNKKFKKNTTLMRRILTIKQSIDFNIKEASDYTKAIDEKYYQQFEQLSSRPWIPHQFEPQYTTIDDIKVFANLSNSEDLSEEGSDRCMVSLLGLNGYAKCSVGVCWRNMTLLGKTAYYPTHELLWLLLGKNNGCGDRMEKLAIKDGYRSVNDIIKRLCAGIVVEMETEYKIGLPSVSLKDVFCEQGAVCGGLGFVDALHPDWLLTVLEWMDPVAGCYKDDFKEIDEGFYYAKYFQTFEDRKNTWKSRKILVDSSTENGCSTHFTGVSIGFLGASLRLFYDPYYVKHRLPLYHKQLPTANMVNEPENEGLYQDDLIIVKVLLVLALFVLVCVVKLKGRKCTRIVRCCW